MATFLRSSSLRRASSLLALPVATAWKAHLPFHTTSRNMSGLTAAYELSIVGEPSSILLESFITDGPLYEKCVGNSGTAPDVELWRERGEFLAKEILNIEQEENGTRRFTRAEAVRIYQYYLPLFFWIESVVGSHRACAAASGTSAPVPPIFVGVSCPQGGGKTTLVDSLSALFHRDGRTCADVSIDDFYLTHADQQRTAARNPGNALLELRGNPGTHDTILALETLQKLKVANDDNSGNSEVSVPRYDKSAFSGRGDRADTSTWPVLKAPIDVVLMEGWCFGFSALPSDTFSGSNSGDSRLTVSNELLSKEYREIHEAMDAWIVVEVESPRQSFEWREQAEANMRAAGKPAMTKAEVQDFVSRYMPAYEHYLPGLYASGPDASEGKPVLSFRIDDGRNPVK